MGTFFFHLSMMFPRLLDHSVEVSVLICLIFLAKLLAPKKLPPWWHYSLWLMLLVRMLVPLEFENPLNVFNFMPAHATPQVSEIIMEAPPENPDSLLSAAPEVQPPNPDIQFAVKKAIPVVWFSGAFILGVCILFESISFWQSVRRKTKVSDEAVLALLSECKSRMKIKRKINVVVTDNVRSPALFGYLRPRLLLPEGVFGKLNERELAYTLMHELGHLKRHDIGVSWLIAILQVIHWFNPLVWLAFYQIRIDQESACDAAVLSKMMPRKSSDYAKAIVGFLEKFCQNCQLPALAGVLENRSQMRKRIARIVQYRKSSQKLSFVAVILLILAGFSLYSLTGVAARKKMPASLSPVVKTNSFKASLAVMENQSGSTENVSEDLRAGTAERTYQWISEWDFPTDITEVKPEDSPVNVSPESEMPRIDETDANSQLAQNKETEYNGTKKNTGTDTPLTVLSDTSGTQTPDIPESERVLASAPVLLEKPSPTPAGSNGPATDDTPSAQTINDSQTNTATSSDQIAAKQIPDTIIREPVKMLQAEANVGIDKQKLQTDSFVDLQEEDDSVHALENRRPSYQSDISPGFNRQESGQNRLMAIAYATDRQMVKKPTQKILQAAPSTVSLTTKRENNDSPGIFLAGEVDTPPQVLKAYPPRYPYIAKRDDITGSITLQFVVTKEGNAVNTKVLESYPQGVFDEAALQAVEQYRFKPGTKDGKAVDVRVNLPIKFNLT